MNTTFQNKDSCGGIVDSHNRVIEYCRISITDRCNHRCLYCMPVNGIPPLRHEDILRYEEIIRIINIFEKMGLTKFRITGGEPLVRKGIFDFLKKIENKNIFITTNLNCGDAEIDMLNSIELSGINISLDSLNPEIYNKISGKDGLENVKKNISKLTNKNKKINCVPLKGYNDGEIFDIIEFALKNDCSPRFIEKMNMNNDALDFIENKQIIELLIKKNIIDSSPEKDSQKSVAEYYKIIGSNKKAGFISPNTKKFCSQCNKLRLTSDGFLKLCLFDDRKIDLKQFIRNSRAADFEIQNFIAEKVKEKWAAYENNKGRQMYYYGG